MVQCGYWVPKKLLFSPRPAIGIGQQLQDAHLSSPVVSPVTTPGTVCRSLSTFILASRLVMPKTPEKRTTDFRDCAATPKKRRKKRVMVDVDETQTCRRGYCTLHVRLISSWSFCVKNIYIQKRQASFSKLLTCSICTFQNRSFLKKLWSFIKGLTIIFL